jgi:UDP-sugar transporter A1/2/3
MRAEMNNKEEKMVEQKPQSPTHFTHGVLPVLMASLISGLAGAISQKNLQNGGRNPYLLSSELCVASVISLSTSLLFSADGKRIQSHGFFDQWTVYTLIPVFTNAVGGIVVGLVTKYAGSVRKGFALIFGMVLTGVAQSIHDGVALSISQIIGGIIAALSLWLHATNPYVKDAGKAGKRQKQD